MAEREKIVTRISREFKSRRSTRIGVALILALCIGGVLGVRWYKHEAQLIEYKSDIVRLSEEQQRFLSREDSYGSQLKISQAEEIYNHLLQSDEDMAAEAAAIIDSMRKAHATIR